ncbi:hypothetical protein KSC_056780 [Ktedonobacter sp. SOSP1-52]|uniref:hypothetical protein n=1 Tax=Ktedonobacter sp. SOSP1-52 TaxID=2778366 RepID=UPI001915A413|nr:hypothetical protein [Ktedonobacter sp. SOSP1-52]GHO66786.1 hypothetical protein KSC_056780 [Ktedonobacter sp. SOSP1-52]
MPKEKQVVMKRETRDLIGQVQDALLALPDAILMETLTRWLDRADEELECLDWSDQYRYACGYRVQSDETGTIYPSFEALDEAEPDGSCWSWVIPSLEAVRSFLVSLPREDFYHTILPLASDALSQQAYEEGWGFPPSVASDGYDFMRCLAVHLRYKGLEGQRPEYGRVSLSWQAFGKRRPMDRSSSDLALWHLCPARHRASPARCTAQGAWQ